MTVTVELNPAVEAGLLAQAQARGLSLEDYARQVLEERGAGKPSGMSVDERVRAFEEFVEGFQSDAAIPEEAFQRENWYPDR